MTLTCPRSVFPLCPYNYPSSHKLWAYDTSHVWNNWSCWYPIWHNWNFAIENRETLTFEQCFIVKSQQLWGELHMYIESFFFCETRCLVHQMNPGWFLPDILDIKNNSPLPNGYLHTNFTLLSISLPPPQKKNKYIKKITIIWSFRFPYMIQ